jgi:hypothetical protein
MHEYGSLPRARRDSLLEEAVGEELLLYDQDSHTAHCLSPIAACVWRHCDGEHDLTGLAELAGASESLVADALHELREKDLLVAEPQLMQSTISGESRREAIRRVARYGAAAAAGSMIVSATAATPAMAESVQSKFCTTTGGTGKTCCICTDGSCWTSQVPEVPYFNTEPECKAYCAGKGVNFQQFAAGSRCA